MKARPLFGTRAMQKFAPLRLISSAPLSLSMLAMGCLLFAVESRELRVESQTCSYWQSRVESQTCPPFCLSALSSSGLSTLSSPLREHFLDRLGAGLGERHRPGADVVVLL